MSAIKAIEEAVRATEQWIDDLIQRLGWHNRELTFLALIAALHALRDCLRRDESIYVAGALPPLLRGFYYEGWHPGTHTAVTRESFLQRIHDGVHRNPAVDPEPVARGVLALLADRLPQAELEEAKAATPPSLHNLWPS